MEIDLTPREKAIRAAAIIDTDGCILVNKKSVVRCEVYSRKREILDWLYQEYGGSIRERSGKLRKGYMHRNIFTWTVAALKAEAFLVDIEPFLLLKARQCRYALQMRSTQGYWIRDVDPDLKRAVWNFYAMRIHEWNQI